ncbi:MAG: hypothetical protein J07HR59_00898 [Halorubrum sp. J07HR59]|nr:MAG: hypothetical protein J07HR59_00898 [Halorubrum sp. J07HR59]
MALFGRAKRIEVCWLMRTQDETHQDDLNGYSVGRACVRERIRQRGDVIARKGTLSQAPRHSPCSACRQEVYQAITSGRRLRTFHGARWPAGFGGRRHRDARRRPRGRTVDLSAAPSRRAPDYSNRQSPFARRVGGLD